MRLAGEPGQWGKRCSARGRGRGARGFVVCPSLSESSPTARLSRHPVCSGLLPHVARRSWQPAPAGTMRSAGPSPSSRGFCGKQPAIINRRYLYFHFLAFKVFWNNSFGLFWVIFFAYFLCLGGGAQISSFLRRREDPGCAGIVDKPRASETGGGKK